VCVCVCVCVFARVRVCVHVCVCVFYFNGSKLLTESKINARRCIYFTLILFHVRCEDGLS